MEAGSSSEARTGATGEVTRLRQGASARCGALFADVLRAFRRPGALAVACVIGCGAARAESPPPAPPSPQQQLLAALAGVVAQHPRHVGAIYIAARTAAAMGDEAATFRWLDRLADVGMEDELDPDDFGALVDTPGYRERAARFAAKAPPIGRAERSVETRCADLLPEGTAWDAKRSELLVSSGRRRTVVAIDAHGRCRDVVPAADRGLLAVLGMAVDAREDALWVASTAAPFMVDRRADDAGRALLARIDLATGRVSDVYPLPGAGMLNDLALASDGSVYVTESQRGAVWRVAPRGRALERVVPDDTFESPNGIAWWPTGHLLVADFDGLALVDIGQTTPQAARVRRLATPGDVYLGGIDGLARTASGVVGLQNLVGRTRVWSLAIDVAQARVTRAEVVIRGHADFRNPTTAVVVGDRLLFVADTKLQSLAADGTLTPLPPGRTGHRILEVEVKAP